MNKSDIRNLIYARLSEKTTDDRAICDRVFSISAFYRILNVFIYNSMAGEVDTSGIIKRLLSMGHNVFLPRIKDKEMHLIPINHDTVYVRNAYGILEPIGEPYVGDVDLCIVPLVAFDRKLVRMGRGGGYYDRFLEYSKALKVALAYSVQEYDSIPSEPHDIRMDMIVTEKEIIKYDSASEPHDIAKEKEVIT